MIRVIAILLIVFSMPCLAGDSWPGVPWMEVRAYAWPDREKAKAVILKDLTLKPGVINPRGALLSTKQVQLLIKSVNGRHPEHPTARCYFPHNAFVFYNAARDPVAFVEICFSCSNHRTFPEGAAANLDLVAMAAIFDAHKLPMGKMSSDPPARRTLKTFRK